MAKPMQKKVSDMWDELRSSVDEKENELRGRAASAEAGNDVAYGNEDPDNPEPPPFETERVEPLLKEFKTLQEGMDAVKRPTLRRLYEAEQELSRLDRAAGDITLE